MTNCIPRFKIKVNPKSGLYLGSMYEFTIRASDNYPRTPPIVISCSYILHPNINEYGEVHLECLQVWQPHSSDLSSLAKSLLELFHQPNFNRIINEEVRDWTDVEFIRNVTVWKRSQGVAPGLDQVVYRGQVVPPSPGRASYRESLGFGSCMSLVSDNGHRDNACDCNNEYIVVTNSRKPRPTSARAARAFRQSQHAWQRNVNNNPFRTASLIDLSDVHDSIRGIEPDYEICSVSSDEDNISRRETVADTGPQFEMSYTRLSDSRQSRQTGASSRSRGSSRLSSRENTWNSHSAAHNMLTETQSISRNRNNADLKPDFRKDLNSFL